MAAQRTPYQRSPDGVETRKAVGLRLLPSELARVRHHARSLNWSSALFARRMMLDGLEAFERRHATPATLRRSGDAVSIREGRA